MNTRLLGTLGMIGGVGLLAGEVRHLISGVRITGATVDAPDIVGYLIWGIGGICAFWAIYQLGVTGKGRWTRLLPLVALVGFAAMALASASELIGLTQPATDPLIGVAWLLILLGTVLAAIFALIVRTWTGWRKFAPLFCILTILTFIVGDAGGLLFGSSWVLLGYAVFTSASPAARLAPVPA